MSCVIHLHAFIKVKEYNVTLSTDFGHGAAAPLQLDPDYRWCSRIFFYNCNITTHFIFSDILFFIL